MKAPRSKFGTTRTLPSGKVQAAYMHQGQRHNAPSTFADKEAAERYLRKIQDQIADGEWVAPTKGKNGQIVAANTSGAPMLRDYAATWLDRRRVKGQPLKVRTREQYQMFLDIEILPFLDMPIDQITRPLVRAWHDRPGTKVHMRAGSYILLASILRSALTEDDLITETPCTIRGAGSPPRAKEKDPLTREQIEALMAASGERYRALVAVLGFCGLRFGEAAALKVADVDLKARTMRVRSTAVRAKAGMIDQGRTKTMAGERTIGIATWLVPVLEAHIAAHSTGGLVFPAKKGGLMGQSTFMQVLPFAAKQAGIEVHVHPHLLRHSAATLFAQAPGCTPTKLMRFLGHTTAAQALHYTHASEENLVDMADAM